MITRNNKSIISVRGYLHLRKMIDPLPPLSEEYFNPFSDNMAKLESMISSNFRFNLDGISRFTQHINAALTNRAYIPKSNTIFPELYPEIRGVNERARLRRAYEHLISARVILNREGEYRPLKKTIPIYNELLRYYQEFPKSEEIANRMNSAGSLWIVRRLWTPGIFTIRRLSEFEGRDVPSSSNTIKGFMELGVIERKLRGVYIPGANAQLAMHIFALMVLLWRETTDSNWELPISDVMEPVRYEIIGQNLAEIVRAINDFPVQPYEPIIVVQRSIKRYTTSWKLRNPLEWAANLYLDGISRRVELPNEGLRNILEKVRLVNGNDTIRDAYKKVNFDDTAFVENTEGLAYFSFLELSS